MECMCRSSLAGNIQEHGSKVGINITVVIIEIGKLIKMILILMKFISTIYTELQIVLLKIDIEYYHFTLQGTLKSNFF